MFLLDTNIWLELLLKQERAGEVQKLLQTHAAPDFAMTEFSLYSIGVILTRLKKDELFADFLNDTVEDLSVLVIRLDMAGLSEALAVRRKFQLYFDDAYQYAAAAQYGLTLLSFDRDFDRTERGRQTPADVMGS
jgi:hypothetical protein